MITHDIDQINIPLRQEINSNYPSIGYLLSNAVSLADQSVYNLNKQHYESYYKKYVNEAKIVIKQFLQTSIGQKTVVKKVDQYKHCLENELKEKQFIDLKLKQNRLKYLSVLTEILDKKDVSIKEFEDLLVDKIEPSIVNVKNILRDLEDNLSGLIFYSDGLVHVKVMNIGYGISKLDKDIFRSSNELSIINNAEFQKLINYSTIS